MQKSTLSDLSLSVCSLLSYD